MPYELKRLPKEIGDCQACTESINVEIYRVHGDMWLCLSCIKLEDEADARAPKQQQIRDDFDRKPPATPRYDTPIDHVTDIHNAQSKAFIDMQAEILANDAIPEADKQLAICDGIKAARANLQRVIFDAQNLIDDAKQADKFWHTNGQLEVAKLSVEKRAHYTELDVNYPAKPTKQSKPTKERAPKPPSSKPKPVKVSDIDSALAKYGLKDDRKMRARLVLEAESRKISIDAAAQRLAEFYAS